MRSIRNRSGKHRLLRAVVSVSLAGGAIVALSSAPASAQAPGPGSLDPTFGTGGVTVQAAARSGYSGGGFQASAAAVDASGRFVLAGGDAGPSGTDSALARFNADGTPDTSFVGGATGISTDESGTGINDNYTGVGVNLTTGDIYTASQYGFGGPGGRVRVEHRDPNGNLIASLVIGGGVGGVNSIIGLGLAVQPDGDVLVSGSESYNSLDFGRMYVVRLTASLGFDNSFGGGGTAFAQFGSFRAVNQGITVQPDGKIILSGSVRSGGDNTALARFTSTGQLDPGFGNGGEVLFDAGQGANEQAPSVAVAPDGRIAVGGNFDPASAFVAELDSSGALIPSFGVNGLYRSTAGTSLWEGAVAWDPAGRIVVDFGGNGGFSVRRLDGSTGALDTTFGTSGTATASCSGPFTDGVFVTGTRIVVTGGCNGAMMLAGFLPNAPASVSDLTVSITGATAAAGYPAVDLATLDTSRLADGLAALQGAPLRGSPLRGSPLRGSPLRGSPLRGSPLRGSPLRGSPFPVPIPLSTIPLVQTSPSDPSWTDVLAGTQYAGLPLQSVTLQQVLALDPAPTALDDLSLAQIDLSNSPLVSTSFTAVFLWGIPLASLPLPAGAASWCGFLSSQPLGCAAGAVDPATWDLLDLELGGDHLDSYYASPIELAGVPLRTSAGTSVLGNVYLRDVALSATPLAALPTSDPAVATLLTCADRCPATLGAAQDAAASNVTADARVVDAMALVPGHGVRSVPLAQLLAGLVQPRQVPVEQMPLDSLLAQAPVRTTGDFHHVASFQRWCSAGADPASLDVTLPSGSRIVASSVELDVNGSSVPTAAPTQLGAPGAFEFALPTLCSGSAPIPINLGFDVEPPAVLGAFAATDVLHASDGDQSATSNAATVVDARDTTDDSPASPNVMAADVLYTSYVSHPGDVDYWHLAAPPLGSSVTISLSHLPADYDLVVYGAQNDVAASPLRGSPPRGSPLRGSPVADTTGNDTTTAASAEGLADVPMGDGVRGSSLNRGFTPESVTFVVRPNDAAHGFDVQVTGFNGASSPKPYALRASVVAGPGLAPCPPTTLKLGAPSQPGAAPSGSEQTLILVNAQRMAAQYGDAATAAMMAKLQAYAARPDVAGLVVPVDADATVRNAYATWDSSPCAPEAANAVVSAINALVDGLRPSTPQLRDVVIVGADNAIPMARIPDLTAVDNQVSYTDAVRYGGTDNDISAAFAQGYVLSDDPYGDFDPQPWLDGHLYVPDVGLGRLVETPADVSAAVDAYVNANGVLNPSTGFVTGYDFLSDAAQSILDSARAGTGSASGLIGSTWTAADAANGIATHSGGLISVNAHYDHYEALPAAEFTAGTTADLLTTAALSTTQKGSVMFTIGCEGGLNVPDSLVTAPSPAEAASLADWPQTATGKGAVYTGNTGYGYGDTDAIAYSERLYAYYAQNVAAKQMTIGQSLMFAKQRYNGELGVAGVYDAKALEESVTYGLPTYRISSAGGVGAVALPPLPASPVGGTATASPFQVSITTSPVTDQHGTHWEVPGQLPQVTQHRPIEPRETIAYPRKGDQRVHGVVLTSATSNDVMGVDPAYSTPTVDSSANEPELTAGQAIFPAALQAVNATATADGPVDDVVLMPGQFIADPSGSGKGTQRLFSALGGTVYTSASTDFEAPDITSVATTFSGAKASLAVTTDATDVMGGVALYRDNVSAQWRSVPLSVQQSVSGTTLTAYLPAAPGATAITDLSAQVVDAAGNVGISSSKGAGYRATVATSSLTLSTEPARPASGWFTGPVSVVVTADGPAAVSLDGADPQLYNGPLTVTGDGTHQVVATAGDLSSSLSVSIDTTAPTIGGLVDGQTLLAGSTVTVTCADPQPGSGMASCSGGGAVPTSSVGTFTQRVTATDNAGNVTTQTLHYSVVKFLGYLPFNGSQPVHFVAGTPMLFSFNVLTAQNTLLKDPKQVSVSTIARTCDPGENAGTSGGDLSTARSVIVWDPLINRLAGAYQTPRYHGCIAMTLTYQSLVLVTFAISLK